MRTERNNLVRHSVRRGLLLTIIFALGLFVPHAIAADLTPQAGQTGSGNTSLVLHLRNAGEFGGTGATDALSNPDLDGDGLGDNLAFTVPTRIDFIATPDGALCGPRPEVVFIENESAYAVHVSSLKVRPLNNWNIVDDALKSSADNSIDITVGPSDDRLNGAAYLEKADIENAFRWNMGPRTNDGLTDRVQLEFSGHINNVVHDMREEMAFGQIEWYVSTGVATREES